MSEPPQLDSPWLAANTALAALSAAGVPEDDPRVQELLAELDDLEYQAGRRYLAKPIEDRTK